MAVGDKPLWQQRDPYGENILSGRFDWRDERVLKEISDFINFGLIDSRENIRRQSRYNSAQNRKRMKPTTGALLRSVMWRTWSEAGGDVQVFHAQYLYYSKFVELALGKGNPFVALPPGIPGKQWKPITMPDRTRKARPSVPTEMRKRARRFTTFVQDHFSYAGIAMLVYSMRADNAHAAAINRALFAHGLSGRENR